MSIWDLLSSPKTQQIFDMVMRMTSWMTGLDERLNLIERRLGAMEMALTGKGIQVPPIDSQDKSPRKGP
jgi:hypothetical protein